MSSTPNCGNTPVDGVLAVPLGSGISLTLVRSADGYCFSAWMRHDGRAMPLVDDELKRRVFATVEAAADFFRDLLQTQA